MTILALGLSYRTVAVDIRERLAFAPEDAPRALASLRAATGVDEAVILSTCNRTEIYCSAEVLDTEAVAAWLAQDRGFDCGLMRPFCYAFRDGDAAAHAMRVACGLDSQVLGEPQITGQFKTAFEAARRHGHVGAELGPLGDKSLSIAKRVRTETGIGRNPVSIAYAAVTLARRVFPDLADAPTLLLGAGENVELLAKHLTAAGVRCVDVANRTLAHAEALAERLQGEAFSLAELDARLPRYDLIISSTGSPHPVLGMESVQRALKLRDQRPVFMVDVAVPRDIEPEVGALDPVHLYSVDALTEIIDENVAGRREEAEKANGIVSAGVAELEARQRLHRSRAVLQCYREHGEDVRAAALDDARRRLEAGDEPAAVLERLAHDLAKKLMHGPTLAIREASASGNEELLAAVRRFVGL